MASPYKRRQKPIAIDLFSGCGGLTEGLRQAGFRVVGAIEMDPLAVETYKSNHRRVKVWQSDIRKVSAKSMMRALKLSPGELDLLAGCPPCQGFSRMTTLNGRIGRDERNDLILDFLRFVRVMRPQAVMLENVPALLRNRRLAKVCRTLRGMGYTVQRRVLNAADYNVPQRRHRLILLAGVHGPIAFSPPVNNVVTVRDAFSRLRRPRTDPLHTLPETRSQRIERLIRSIPLNGGSRGDLPRSRQLKCHRKSDGFKDVYGRMSLDDIAPTITGGCCNPSKGRFLHPLEHRTISLREAALLQTFPPLYSFSLRRGKFAAAQMIGNALPPEFIRRHAIQIAAYVKGIPQAG